jgi:MFS transporter, putative metabolite:H+ symporter
MGLGAGGLLPLTFTLLAEIIPARHRGWAMVLVGADAAAAYILTSWLAGWLAPHYSWRILWLIGLPTGLLLVVLNRWIPESPLFLLSQGRPDEAQVILEQYGAEIIEDPGSAPPSQRGSYWQLIRRPFAGVAAGIGVSAIGVGLITYGFQLWLPTNLQEIGFTGVTAAKVLRNSALLGFPLTLLAAWLYGFWSSKKTIFALSVVTIAALIGLALAPTSHAVLQAMLAIPIATTGSLAAVLAAYGAEIYPTRIRARATGMAAGASKVGGVIIIALVAASLAIPSLATTALLGVIPLAAAIVLIAVSGRETRGQRLDAIVPVASPETAVPLT